MELRAGWTRDTFAEPLRDHDLKVLLPEVLHVVIATKTQLASYPWQHGPILL